MSKRPRIIEGDDELSRIDKAHRQLSEFQAALRIDKHALDDALIEQPVLFDRVARECANAISLRDAAKQKIDDAKANADSEIRGDYNSSGEKKPSEAQIQQEVLRDRDVQAATSDFLEWKTVADLWGALRDAYVQRSHALQDLVRLYTAGYFGERIGAGERRGAEQRTYANNREALAAARKNGGEHR